MTIDFKYINDLLKEYKFGIYDSIDIDKTKVLINPVDKTALITNLYEHKKENRHGTCAEVSNSFYLNLLFDKPEYNVLRAVLKHYSYSKRYMMIHNALLISETGEPLTDKPFIYTKKDLEEIAKKDPYVIDPSRKRMLKFSKTDYELYKTYNDDVIVSFSSSELLKEGELSFVGYMSKNEMINIGVSFEREKFPSFIYLSFKKYKEPSRRFDLFSHRLTKVAEEKPELIKFINNLRSVPFNLTREKLIAYEDSSIPFRNTSVDDIILI
ncbi:MAG: hypothetical protein AB7V77_00900 [Candidatus Woesearchaeota archaeon]